MIVLISRAEAWKKRGGRGGRTMRDSKIPARLIITIFRYGSATLLFSFSRFVKGRMAVLGESSCLQW